MLREGGRDCSGSFPKLEAVQNTTQKELLSSFLGDVLLAETRELQAESQLDRPNKL